MNVGDSYVGETGAKITKVREFRLYGCACEPTAVDGEKASVDFLLLQVCPNVIEWKDGRRERVTDAKLEKLQSAHSWLTDF